LLLGDHFTVPEETTGAANTMRQHWFAAALAILDLRRLDGVVGAAMPLLGVTGAPFRYGHDNKFLHML
jgi:hypothetical protein